ncbi:hypothetical protein LINPERPRIM_LOCUS21968 [Linum perenne]
MVSSDSPPHLSKRKEWILAAEPNGISSLNAEHPQVSDLGHLIGLYSEWHGRLLPYYSFDQFTQRVERVAPTSV